MENFAKNQMVWMWIDLS